LGIQEKNKRRKEEMKKYIIPVLLTIILINSYCGRRISPAISGISKGKEYDSAAFEYVYVEAIKQKILGNSGDALKYLEQCAKMNPESDAVYYQMAQILLSGGDVRNGKKMAKLAVKYDNSNIWYLMMLAGIYYQEKNLDSAIIYYEQAVRKYPERDEILLNLGNLYSETNKFDKALEIFNKLDKKYGLNEGSTIANVRNLIKLKKFDDALVLIRKLLEESPDEILYNGLLAEIYREKGDKDKAMEVYNALIERNPDNAETQLSLCDFLISEKRYDELILLINKVILNENVIREHKIGLFAKIIENDEIVKSKGGDLILSLMIFEAAYKDDGIIQLLRPELLIKLKNLKEAAKRLEEMIEQRPDNYFAWEKLLIVYLDDREYKKLEERGAECARKFNRSFIAKMLYAAGAAENKNYETALEEIRKAEILAGDNEEMILQVLTTRADVYYKMKDYGKSFEIFETAINRSKNDLTLLNNYAYYLAEQNMRLKEAERMSRKVIEKEKDNYTFLDTYAWVLYKRGKLREAEKLMESIIKNTEKEDAEFYEHMGYIKRKRGKCREAIDNWQNALNLDSTKTELLQEIEKCRLKN